MNKLYYVVIIALVVLVGVYFISKNVTSEVQVEKGNSFTKEQVVQKISVKQQGFEQIGFLDFEVIPEVTSVKVGTIVRWTNFGQKPQIVKGIGFESPVLQKGDYFEHTFTAAGGYTFVSDVREFAILDGAINVT